MLSWIGRRGNLPSDAPKSARDAKVMVGGTWRSTNTGCLQGTPILPSIAIAICISGACARIVKVGDTLPLKRHAPGMTGSLYRTWAGVIIGTSASIVDRYLMLTVAIEPAKMQS